MLRDALAARRRFQIPGIAPIAQLDRTSLCHLYWGLQWRQSVGPAAMAGQCQCDGRWQSLQVMVGFTEEVTRRHFVNPPRPSHPLQHPWRLEPAGESVRS